MKPVKQLVLHKPQHGQYGDCFRASLASLMERAAETVPHFLEDNPPADIFWQRVDEWLMSNNLAIAHLAFDCPLEQVLSFMGSLNPGLYYLLGGKSPRGTGHAVVACGGRIVHDPHPEGGNLVGPDEDGLYRANLLVPLFYTLTPFDEWLTREAENQ